MICETIGSFRIEVKAIVSNVSQQLQPTSGRGANPHFTLSSDS